MPPCMSMMRGVGPLTSTLRTSAWETFSGSMARMRSSIARSTTAGLARGTARRHRAAAERRRRRSASRQNAGCEKCRRAMLASLRAQVIHRSLIRLDVLARERARPVGDADVQAFPHRSGGDHDRRHRTGRNRAQIMQDTGVSPGTPFQMRLDVQRRQAAPYRIVLCIHLFVLLGSHEPPCEATASEEEQRLQVELAALHALGLRVHVACQCFQGDVRGHRVRHEERAQELAEGPMRGARRPGRAG